MRRLAVFAAVFAVVVLGTLASGAVWLFRTASGMEWAFGHLVAASRGRLVVERPAGSLGRELTVARVHWADGDWEVEARSLRLRVSWRSLLAGTLRFDQPRAEQVTIVHAQGQPGPPPSNLGLPMRLVLDGARIARAGLRMGGRDVTVVDLGFSYAGGPDEHRLHELRAAVAGWDVALSGAMAAGAPFEIHADGRATGEGVSIGATATVRPMADAPLIDLHARASGVDLSRFSATLPRTAMTISLEGRGTGGARIGGRFSLRNDLAGAIETGRLPLSRANAEFAFDGTSLRLDAIDARAMGGRVAGAASLRWPFAGNADLKLEGLDLRQIRSNFLQTALSGRVAATFEGDALSGRATLEQDGMRLSIDAARRGQLIDVRAFHLEAQGGSASGRGEVTLRPSFSMRGEVAFDHFDPSRFGRFPEASLGGRIEVSGRVQSPRALNAAWRILPGRLLGRAFSSSGSARLEEGRVRDVDAQAQWGVATLRARGALGAPTDALDWTLAAVGLSVPGFEGAVRARGRASGSWRAPRVEFDASATGVRLADRIGFTHLDAHGAGSVEAHTLRLTAEARESRLSAWIRGGWSRGRWEGSIDSLANEGRYPLSLEGPVAVRAGGDAVSIGAVRAALGGGRLEIDSFDWTPARLSSAGRVSGLPAAWLIALAGIAGQVRATLLMDGDWLLQSSAGGRSSFKDGLNGSLRLRRRSGDVTLLEPSTRDLGLREATLDALFDQGAVRARIAARSTLGDMDAQGRLEALDRAARFAFEASLQLADLRVLTGPLPENLRLAGRLAAQVSGRGTLDAPELAGRLSADALQLQLPPYGVYLDDGRLEATLAGDRLRIDALSLRGGQGRVTATGFVPLASGSREAGIEWEARNLLALGRPDLRLVVSGRGRAALRDRRVALDGALTVEQGRIERELRALPRLDEDIVVRGREARDRTRDRIPVELDLDVALGKRLSVRQAGFDGRLEGRLRLLAGADGELRAEGRVVAADATFRAYGQALAVDPGVLIFAGPVRNPALQIDAWRRNQAVAAGVRITGSLQAPRVELVSDPPVPENEKLSWLVLGQAPGNASGADLALLQTAAGALLGRGRESVPVTRRIADALGLDEIALRGSGDLAGRVVALGKRLSDRIYVSYEQGIGALAQSLVKLDLQLTSRISLRAQTGSSSGAGVFYRYSWD